ncbi:MAG TPA: hypothetical protein P5084_02640 [Paludibacter sp.]|nr:hypothetical protein [Paludibacter sp.]
MDKRSKDELSRKLIESNRFWSNDINLSEDIPDDILIEKSLIFLDIDDINQLFKLYSHSKIKKVWLDRMVVQGDYYKKLNRLIAWMYFDIKNPDKYINRVVNEHYKKLQCLH